MAKEKKNAKQKAEQEAELGAELEVKTIEVKLLCKYGKGLPNEIVKMDIEEANTLKELGFIKYV